MGIIITKFKKKKTTYEILEKLENEIQSIEEFRRSTEQTQKKMVVRFICISICVYFVTAFILYFYFFPASAYERIIYIIPLIILPVLLIFIKRILSWYYNRKIRKNQKKLTSLKDEKKKILEEVMDKETYKVAKNILDKFAPEQMKKNISMALGESTPARRSFGAPAAQSSVALNQTGLRYRGQFGVPPKQLGVELPTPKSIQSFVPPSTTPALRRSPQAQSVVPSAVPGTPLLLPRAILPRERSVLDKMVDYLVGDGPSNRYALICKNCSSHNGMALKEEFDYLSFRCCYCLTFNPARKKRPAAPKLNVSLAIKNKGSDISESDRNSPSDSDLESEDGGPIITEPSEDKITTDKLSDIEVKSSDTEISSTEVESFVHLSAEKPSQTSDSKNNADSEVNTETKKED